MAVVANLEAILTANDQMTPVLQRAGQQVDALGGRTGGVMGGVMGGVLGAGIVTGVFNGIMDGITGSIGLAKDFEFQMDAVNAALGGLDASQMEAIEQQAMDLGASTKFSAGEIGMVQESLAKAGISAEQLLAGATQATVDLSAATGEDLVASGEAAAGMMNLFGLGAEDMTGIADTLTASLNNSSASLPDMQRGINTLGAEMVNLNRYAGDPEQAFVDTAAAVAYFNAQGLKAADAGVSLARGMTNLSDPTSEASGWMQQLGINAFDMEGNMLPLPDLFDQLQQGLGGVDDQTRMAALSAIFGAEAADVMSKAIQAGGDPLREYEKLMESNGQAMEQAAIRQDNLTGDVEEFGGALQTLAIKGLSPILPLFRGIVQAGTGMIDGLIGGIEAFGKEYGGAFRRVANETKHWLKQGINPLSAAMAGLAGGMEEVFGENFVSNFLRDTAEQLTTVAGAFARAGNEMRYWMDQGVNPLSSGLAGLAGGIEEIFGDNAVSNWLRDTAERIDDLGPAVSRVANETKHWLDQGVNPLSSAMAGLAGGVETVFGKNAVSDWLRTAAEDIHQFLPAFEEFRESALAMGDNEISAGIRSFGDALKEATGIDITGFTSGLADLTTGVGDFLGAIGDQDWDQVGTMVEDALGNIGEAIGGAFEALGAIDLEEVVVNIASWAQGVWADFSGFVSDIITGEGSGLGATIHDVLVNIGSWALGTIASIGDFLNTALTGQGGSADYDAQGNFGGGGFAGVDLAEVAVNILSWAQGKFEDLGTWLSDVAIPALGDLAADLGTVAVNIAGWVMGQVADLGAFLSGIFGGGAGGSADYDAMGNFGGGGFEGVTLEGVLVSIGSWEIGDVNVADLFTKLMDAIRTVWESPDAAALAQAEEIGKTVGTAVGELLAAGISAGISAVFSGGGGGGGGGADYDATGLFGGGGMGALADSINLGDLFAGFDAQFSAAVMAELEPAIDAAFDMIEQKAKAKITEKWNEFWDNVSTWQGEGALVQLDPRLPVAGRPLRPGEEPPDMTGELFQGPPTLDWVPEWARPQGAGAQEAEALTPEMEAMAQRFADSLGATMGQALSSEGFAAALNEAMQSEAGTMTFDEIAGTINDNLFAALERDFAPADDGSASLIATDMATTLADGIASGITAVDPTVFSNVGTALMDKVQSAIAIAMRDPSVISGAGGGVDKEIPGGGMGAQLVQGLATQLSSSIAQANPAVFAPVGTAIGAKLQEALGTALQPTKTDSQTGAATQFGQDIAGTMITNMASQLASSIAAADASVFAPVGAALSAKINEGLSAAMSGGGGDSMGGPGERGEAFAAGDTMMQGIVASLAAGVTSADWSTFQTALDTSIQTAITAASTTAAVPAQEIGTALVTNAGYGIGPATATFSSAVTAFVDAGVAAGVAHATSASPQIGTAVATNAGTGIGANTGTFQSAITAMVDAGIAAGVGAAAGASAIGAAISSGAAAGIDVNALVGPAVAMVNNAIAAANAAAGSASPSKEFMKVSQNMTDGAVIGFEQGTPAVEDASRKMVESAMGATEQAAQLGQDAGTAIAEGMADGLSSAQGTIDETWQSVLSRLEEQFADAPSIVAPYFEDILASLSEGRGGSLGLADDPGGKRTDEWTGTGDEWRNVPRGLFGDTAPEREIPETVTVQVMIDGETLIGETVAPLTEAIRTTGKGRGYGTT